MEATSIAIKWIVTRDVLNPFTVLLFPAAIILEIYDAIGGEIVRRIVARLAWQCPVVLEEQVPIVKIDIGIAVEISL